MFSEDGRRFLATQFTAGHWFGEAPLLDDKARAFHAEAMEETEVAVLPASAFWHIMQSDASALLAVTRLLCARYRAALGWIEDASLRPLPARLAKRLLALADASGASGRFASEIRVSQEELAAQLGVARQTVNKQLKQWEREGLLLLRYASVQLCDMPALHRLAAQR